jgi:hypothetical protein
MASDGMIYILSFVKIDMDIQAKFTLLKAAILALQLGGIHDECR